MTGPRKAYRQDTFRTQTFAGALEELAVSELDSADVAANKLAARLEEACDQSMQQRKTFRKHHAPMYWWSEEIASLRRTCLRARRLVQRARGTANLSACNSSFKSAKKALKLEIRDSKRESYLELCDELENDPWGRAYKTVVKRVSAGNRSPTDPAFLEGIVQVLFPKGRRYCNPVIAITETELLSVARNLKSRKAPGPDLVPNRAVKTLLSLHPGAVASLYNRWKRQTLLLLPKPGKPAGEASSYRPICLLDTIGKVFERVIATRLNAVDSLPTSTVSEKGNLHWTR